MRPDKEQEFKEIYHAHKDKVFRLCLGFVGKEAEAKDLFQEVMLKVWDKWDSFRGNSSISTWIYRIATNTALLSLNRKKRTASRQGPLPVDVAEESWDEPQEDTHTKIQKLRKLISGFREIDRLVLSLLLEGCTYEEIADITGLSMSNVGVKINRLKKRLKKKFQTHE